MGELLKSDAYNESKIQESIEKAGKEECITIAIQLAVVGYGNKNFGSYKFNGEERDMIQFFERNNIKWNLKMGEKLSEDQLTPSRLIRFCRYYIESYIKKNIVQFKMIFFLKIFIEDVNILLILRTRNLL